MLLYQNLGRVAKQYYNIRWNPGEILESPGYINDPEFIYQGVAVQSNSVKQHYLIKFKNYDGKLLSSNTYAEGDYPTPPEHPTRKASSAYSYTFAGWRPDVSKVTAAAEYVATYIKSDAVATQSKLKTNKSKTSNTEDNLDGTDNNK